MNEKITRGSIVMEENYMTDCEVLVMKTIWDSEELLALRGVTEQVNSKFNKEWKPQTVSTFLARLVRKGFLTMERKGRQFYYYTEVSKEEYGKKEITNCVDFWCEGALDKFITSYLEERKLSKDEIESVKKVINSL